MSEFKLDAAPRVASGKKNAKLRENFILPVVVYGSGSENQVLQVSSGEFNKLYTQAGESSLIDLSIDGKKTVPVLIHDVQHSPLGGEIVHADLYAVDLNKKLRASVDLVFEGESMAVKAYGGILVKHMDYVEIECLPKDLIKSISVDLSALNNFDDRILISNLVVPESVVITLDKNEPVVSVSAPEEEIIEAAAPVAEMPVVEAKKGEEGEEGAAVEGSSEKKNEKKVEKK